MTKKTEDKKAKDEAPDNLSPDALPIPGGAAPIDTDKGREEAKKYVRPEDER